VEQAETRRWYGWMLLQRGDAGDAEQARSLLGEGIDLYQALGMEKHVGLAQALL
jgi:hypothetical protein